MEEEEKKKAERYDERQQKKLQKKQQMKIQKKIQKKLKAVQDTRKQQFYNLYLGQLKCYAHFAGPKKIPRRMNEPQSLRGLNEERA